MDFKEEIVNYIDAQIKLDSAEKELNNQRRDLESRLRAELKKDFEEINARHETKLESIDCNLSCLRLPDKLEYNFSLYINRIVRGGHKIMEDDEKEAALVEFKDDFKKLSEKYSAIKIEYPVTVGSMNSYKKFKF